MRWLWKEVKPPNIRTEPKPLLKVNEITLLENCIDLIKSLGIKKIILTHFI